MRMTEHEQERLLITLAAEVAWRRRERGLRLNHPEATAILTSWVLEGARDGRTVADLMSAGRSVLSRADVMEGVPEMIDSVQVEATAPGTPKVREGASTPSVFARMLQDMTPEQYAQRERLLVGVRYLLPLEPMIDIAKQWAVDGGAYSNLDLGSWSRIYSPQAAAHGG